MNIRFATLPGLENVRKPAMVSPADAGLTIYTCENFTLEKGEVHAYRTGLLMEIPEGTYGQLVTDHNSAFKGVQVFGVILPSNVGELRVTLFNGHADATVIKAGQAVAQLVLIDSEEYEAQEVVFDDLQVALVERKEKASRKARENQLRAQSEDFNKEADKLSK